MFDNMSTMRGARINDSNQILINTPQYEHRYFTLNLELRLLGVPEILISAETSDSSHNLTECNRTGLG